MAKYEHRFPEETPMLGAHCRRQLSQNNQNSWHLWQPPQGLVGSELRLHARAEPLIELDLFLPYMRCSIVSCRQHLQQTSNPGPMNLNAHAAAAWAKRMQFAPSRCLYTGPAAIRGISHSARTVTRERIPALKWTRPHIPAQPLAGKQTDKFIFSIWLGLCLLFFPVWHSIPWLWASGHIWFYKLSATAELLGRSGALV